jgi:polysaccharide biosynthesis protein PelE
MIELAAFFFALLCEGGAVMAPLLRGETQVAIGAFVLLHLIASLTLAAAIPGLLPADHMGGRKQGILIFSFTFFIPVFGLLGMIAIMIHFRLRRKKGWRPEFYSIPQLPFSEVDGVKPVRMGEGGAWSRLRTESSTRTAKLEAIMAAGAAPGQNASRLLRLATGDSDDEIRLVAFNLFDRREKTINSSINHLLSELNESCEDREKGDICARLAFAYWEFVYNELARAELMEFYLDQAFSFVCKAEELSGESHPLSMLKGRIYLRRGHMEEAERAIERAMELGAPADKAVPFRAEIMYRKRDFNALKRLFNGHSNLRHKPGIGAVVSFWTEA